MAGSSREVTIEVGGQPYRLVLNINAMIALENEVDQSFGDVMVQCSKGRLSAIRAALWAALQTHHPTMRLDDVGVWMDEVGLDLLIQSLQRLSGEATPDPEDANDLGISKRRPRKARAR